jgi:hypothetical protein
MDMEHRHDKAVWTCSIDMGMQHRHTAWICIKDMHRLATETCSMVMQLGYAAKTCSIDIQHGHAA